MEGAGIGRGFSGDPAVAPAELVQFLDACRQIDPIAQTKQWMLDQLQLAAGQSVLDVGCGTGDDVAAAAAVVGPSGSAVGVDSSEAMVAEASSRHGGLPEVSFQLGDAQQLPFESDSFDACRAERVLQHVPDPDRAVSEMARVLRPGGRLALMEPDWDGFLIDGSDPVVSGAIWRHTLAGVRQPYVGRRLRALLVQHGFVEIEVKGAAEVITALDRVAHVFEFAAAASGAVEAGIVSAEDATRWLDDLQDADRDGRFLCAIVSFRTVGVLG